MPRIPKRLLALGGLAAGGAAFLRRRRGGAAPAPAPAAPTPPAPAAAPPVATAGATAAAPVVAPPPPETPGPSVTPPTAGGPGSETEREEAADALTPEPDATPAAEEAAAAAPSAPRPAVHTDDDFVAREEAAAAAEARGIGGPRLDDAHGDEAMEPVYEAGGGEAEGFEAAEDQLIENATHGGGRADPIGDAFTPEAESDEQTAVYGEPDEERVSELGEDETDRR